MTPETVHILPLNGGNISSVKNALQKIGAEGKEIRSETDLEEASRIIIPGIGHFDRAIQALEQQGFITLLTKAILEKQVPTLGICLGMQLLAAASDEGSEKGLHIFNASIREFTVEDTEHFKIPHNGWNTIELVNDCPLFKSIDPNDEFFFLHKYTWSSADDSEVVGITRYETGFPSVIGKNNCWGVQFHPEKSHSAGLQLLRNFLLL